VIDALYATWKLLANRRLWLGPDRLGHLIDVLEWLDARQLAKGR
jgi:hypothetical protein